MNSPAPPQIFSPARRLAVRRRARMLGHGPDAQSYVLADMAEDTLERLAFMRHRARRALVIGDAGPSLAQTLAAQGSDVVLADPLGAFDRLDLDEQRPYPLAGFDLIVSLGTLDTVNDLPGALIHMRNALAPGGLAIASFIGAGSLQGLRAAMLAADGDRPAPRMHPAVDVRAAGQLLQRAGWADPVVDCRTLNVRFSSLDSLVADLRGQGLSNCLARPGPPLTRRQYALAREQFGSGRVETFEILTLTGWKR